MQKSPIENSGVSKQTEISAFNQVNNFTEKSSSNRKLNNQTTPSIGKIATSVFGRNLNFVDSLWEELRYEEFLNEDCRQEVFVTYFSPEGAYKQKLILYAKNLADFGFLLKELKRFFLEEYQDERFYNQFWADRFLFYTNGTKQPVEKNSTDISKIIRTKILSYPEMEIQINKYKYKGRDIF